MTEETRKKIEEEAQLRYREQFIEVYNPETISAERVRELKKNLLREAFRSGAKYGYSLAEEEADDIANELSDTIIAKDELFDLCKAKDAEIAILRELYCQAIF